MEAAKFDVNPDMKQNTHSDFFTRAGCIISVWFILGLLSVMALLTAGASFKELMFDLDFSCHEDYTTGWVSHGPHGPAGH